MTESTHELEFLFHPRAVAVAGVSTKEGPGLSGGSFVSSLLEIGFPGPIYLVHPSADAIRGLKCYRSVLDIPDEVDYVISSVSARHVPGLLEECIAKGGVRVLHLFTAGFTETGEAGRAEMEQQVVARARAAGIRVIGPNCMGIYAPASRLAFLPNQPVEAGDVGMISQSGFNCAEFVRYAVPRGLRASKIVSFGNGADLKAADFFDYFADDPQTEIIVAYLEGIQDGPRLAAALRKAGARKRVAILKGGRTEAGGRAATSHTASLAGSLQVFDGLCRQAGVVRVESMEALVDMAATFKYVRAVPGPRVAVVGTGGGASVLAADDIAAAGLQMPPFAADTQEALAKVTAEAGTSVRNPVDSMNMSTETGFEATLMPCALDPGIDIVLYHTSFGGGAGLGARRAAEIRATMQRQVATLARIREESGKAVVVSLRTSTEAGGFEFGLEFQDLGARAGIAVYPGVQRAAEALASLWAWQRGRE